MQGNDITDITCYLILILILNTINQYSNMVFLDRSIRPFYSLNIDSRIMGVGGDDSWTASVHEGNLI